MGRRRSPAKFLARLTGLCCAALTLASAAQADHAGPDLPEGCLAEAGSAGRELEGTLQGAELSAGDGVVYRQVDLHIPNDPAPAMANGDVQPMRFWPVADKPDRWQRQRGHLVNPATGSWVARDLVGKGVAIAAPALAPADCFPPLMRAERIARVRELGLWASEKVYSAHRPDALLPRVGRYTLVAGRVLSVGETRSTLYLNFGYRWSRDFTATIAKEELDAFTAAGVDVRSLEGAAIRIRGVLLQSGGPLVEISHPAQIERLETDGTRR
ncbi:hypothetical protein [Stappia sp. ES.058]|uniref:hypothetical protein n=1 Tax=Stappia sp. ES.058 TaxID=1881061 RepID=UPI00087A1906|nr:hypothetical protein [Stappia sp. ES.058]SDU39849.1 hypothetical protein SAMN05428979_3478 [Stappia sp. ES.058]